MKKSHTGCGAAVMARQFSCLLTHAVLTESLFVCRYFMVLNADENDQPKHIEKGLLVDETNQKDMRVMLKAQKRWQFEDEEKNLHLASLRPLEL